MPGPEPDLAKRELAAELYAEHGTVRAVAEQMGLSSARTYELLREAGVEFGPAHPRPKEPA